MPWADLHIFEFVFYFQKRKPFQLPQTMKFCFPIGRNYKCSTGLISATNFILISKTEIHGPEPAGPGTKQSGPEINIFSARNRSLQCTDQAEFTIQNQSDIQNAI